jgi:hypothetical protein
LSIANWHRFSNADVANLVSEATDERLDKAERKRLQVERAAVLKIKPKIESSNTKNCLHYQVAEI